MEINCSNITTRYQQTWDQLRGTENLFVINKRQEKIAIRIDKSAIIINHREDTYILKLEGYKKSPTVFFKPFSIEIFRGKFPSTVFPPGSPLHQRHLQNMTSLIEKKLEMTMKESYDEIILKELLDRVRKLNSLLLEVKHCESVK